jgi:hypothetical protein
MQTSSARSDQDLGIRRKNKEGTVVSGSSEQIVLKAYEVPRNSNVISAYPGQGLVEVRLADSDKIPYGDEFFDRVYAPNFEAVV